MTSGARFLFGPVGVASLLLSAVAIIIGTWATVLAIQTRNPLLWIGAGIGLLMLIVLIGLALRSLVIVSVKGVRIPGSKLIRSAEITEVVLTIPYQAKNGSKTRLPVLERAVGRAVQSTVLDGLQGSKNSKRLRRQVELIADLVGCALRIEEEAKPVTHHTGAPRRGL